MLKYIILQKEPEKEMDRLFNQPAGLRAGLTLTALYEVQPNRHGYKGKFFLWDEVVPHLGRARDTLQTYTATLTTNSAQDVVMIETDTPEEYGLIIPITQEPEIVV